MGYTTIDNYTTDTLTTKLSTHETFRPFCFVFFWTGKHYPWNTYHKQFVRFSERAHGISRDTEAKFVSTYQI